MDRSAEYHTLRIYLTSKEYLRWVALATRKRNTAAGLGRWLILEYLVRSEQRAQSEQPPPESPSS